MRNMILRKIFSAWNYIQTFVKWIIIASLTGVLGGLIGTAFSHCITYANKINNENWWIVLTMPLGGLVIAALYKLSKIKDSLDTNLVLNSIRTKGYVPWVMSPLIFAGTVITHLVGGSAGREGAALQLGGSLGSVVGRVLKLDEKDMHLAIMCGMSSVFSALFGTPITAAFFALEVISVGVTYYSALVPCFVSSIVAYFLAINLGVQPMRFNVDNVLPEITIGTLAQVIGLSAVCAVVSIVFCVAMRKSTKYAPKIIKNDYLRVVLGALIIVGLTFLIGNRDYNGAGSQIITNALGGIAKPEAFVMKIIFTAVTISCGFKGGEIVPTLFIGSTFGCVFGPVIGLDPSFSAAIGFICLFCGVINCPLASILLSVEVFGASGLIFFAIGASVAYMLSGYYGLYSGQKILYSKLKAEYININAK
ncbi:MAG: chloride channel protein [Ruminococcus sp.]|nr:chloride channel protein [Ruminococcus sp.]